MIQIIKANCLKKIDQERMYYIMKTSKILTVGALALSMVLSGGMLTGCSNSSTKDTKATEVAKKEVKTLGKKTKDSKSLKLTNNTGKKITVFETKSNSEESFGDNLLDDGDAVKNKENRTLYYTVKENDKLDVKVGLQDEDKTFVFKDVDTTDVKKVDVSLKENKVNLDVTKKDGSTATLTPSEDSAKTEDEKKEEQERKKKPQKPILLINQILQNQRRITPLRLAQVQIRTTQVLTVPNLLQNLQTVVAITLVHQSHQITVALTQAVQNLLSINMNGLHSTRL